MAVAAPMEIDSGSSGFNYLEVYNPRGTRIGWVVVAATASPYSSPRYLANHEYFYFNEAITDYSSFDIALVAASTQWPSSWPYGTSATTEWETSNIRPTNYASQAPAPSLKYYKPTVQSPYSNINWLGWEWPTASADGRNEWFASTADFTLSGPVGTRWTFNQDTSNPVYGYLVVQAIPT